METSELIKQLSSVIYAMGLSLRNGHSLPFVPRTLFDITSFEIYYDNLTRKK
jgi:hypothetical protein